MTIPPIYAYTSLNFFSDIDERYLYFRSAREALTFLLKTLKIDVALIPSYTCPTVIEAINSSDSIYDFIDLDSNLDFKKDDLEYMIDFYNGKKIALIPTTLFNAPIRDYKKLYPKLTVIEDLAQSTPIYKQSSDFAIYSFGKSKFISSFGGGVLEGEIDKKPYENLAESCTFIQDYLANIATQTLLKYGWSLLLKRYQKLSDKEYLFHKIEPKRICDIKKRWINSLLKGFNPSHRIKISDLYLNSVKKDKLFDLKKDRPYLRMPIKKLVDIPEVSFMKPYRVVYELALKKRTKKLEIAELLAKNCTFFPTHELVNEKDVENFATMIDKVQ